MPRPRVPVHFWMVFICSLSIWKISERFTVKDIGETNRTLQEFGLCLAAIYGIWNIFKGESSSNSSQTTCLMVIHRPGGARVIQVAKLDSGSSQNLISRSFVLSHCLYMEDYLGPELEPIGPSFRPMGRVTFDWHVSERKRVYTSTFAVIEDGNWTNHFNILLSYPEIAKIGFWSPNSTVFFVEDPIPGPWCTDM